MTEAKRDGVPLQEWQNNMLKVSTYRHSARRRPQSEKGVLVRMKRSRFLLAQERSHPSRAHCAAVERKILDVRCGKVRSKTSSCIAQPASINVANALAYLVLFD